MIDYVDEDDDGMYYYAEEQTWDDETVKQLRDEHNVFFMSAGQDAVIPVKLIPKMDLVVIGSEDDGMISFPREHGLYRNAFSAYWIKSLITDLNSAFNASSYRKENK